MVTASVREELRAVVASIRHRFVTLPSRGPVARGGGRGHSFPFLLLRMAAAIVFAGLSWHGLAVAAEENPALAPKITFQIPEQPLVTALQAYSEESGVHVLYESGVEVGQLSVAIDGEFTREGALRTLLGNSNLLIRYARADSVVLVNPAAAMADEPPDEVVLGGTDLALETLHVASPQAIVPDRAALNDYIGVLQQDVQQALRKGGKKSSGNYRVGLDLWVDPSRIIRKTEVFRSTGDRERDVAISEVLQGLVIKKDPPARTQQPVRVMIVVKSL
jgi:hypothetical protein